MFPFNGIKHPLTPNKVNEALQRFCKAAEVRYLSTHKMRFWCASQMYESGIPESAIMYAMNHKDLSTTRHYNRSYTWGLSDTEKAAITAALNEKV